MGKRSYGLAIQRRLYVSIRLMYGTRAICANDLSLYRQGTQMKFRTKDDAMRFAANQGWDFYVQEPHKRQFRVKQYATNFQHSPGKLKHIRTK